MIEFYDSKKQIERHSYWMKQNSSWKLQKSIERFRSVRAFVCTYFKEKQKLSHSYMFQPMVSVFELVISALCIILIRFMVLYSFDQLASPQREQENKQGLARHVLNKPSISQSEKGSCLELDHICGATALGLAVNELQLAIQVDLVSSQSGPGQRFRGTIA
jgi:hypothetical protein